MELPSTPSRPVSPTGYRCITPIRSAVQDSDGDSLGDGDEVHVHGTSPILADTDGDGYDDGVEIGAGSSPVDAGDIPGAASGDINYDGLIDVRDLLLMRSYVLDDVTPSTDAGLCADVAPRSGGFAVPDGDINAADLMILMRMVSGELGD